MAIAIWCAYFAVSFVGFQIFLSALRSMLLEKCSEDYSGKHFAKQAIQATLTLIATVSLDQALQKTAQLEKSKKITPRVFLYCLASVPFAWLIPLVLMGLLVMNFSGALVGAIGIILWVISRFVPRIEKRALLFVGWSIFAIGFEQTLRQSALLMNAALDQSWIYWLGDSSIQSCLLLFVAGVLKVFLVRLPYLTIISSALLLISGVMSLPSAISFVLGEVFFWYLWFALKQAPAHEKKSAQIRAGISLLVAVIFFAIFPLYIGYLDLAFSEQYSTGLRFDQFIVSLGLWFGLDLAISAVFFHYFSLKRSGPAK